jgi:hypothetical protein
MIRRMPLRHLPPRARARPTAPSSANAVEKIRDPHRRAGELQALDAGRQHIDGDNRSGDVEPSVAELRRAQERRRERRQQVGRADGRVAGARLGLTSTPASPATAPQGTNDSTTTAAVRTPASRAASALPPVAYYTRRPAGVDSGTYQTTTAMISM